MFSLSFLHPFKAWILSLFWWLLRRQFSWPLCSWLFAAWFTWLVWRQFFLTRYSLKSVYTIPRIETLIQGQPFGRTEIPATSVDEFVRNQSEPSTTNRLNAMPRNDSSTTAQSHTLSWHDEPIKGLYYYPLEGPAAGLETRFHVITNHSMERILVTYPYNNSVDNLSEGMRLKAQESLQLRLEFCARGGPPDNATSITVAIPFPLGKYGVATLASYLGACILSLVKLAGLGLIWALWLWFWCDRLFGYVDGI